MPAQVGEAGDTPHRIAASMRLCGFASLSQRQRLGASGNEPSAQGLRRLVRGRPSPREIA